MPGGRGRERGGSGMERGLRGMKRDLLAGCRMWDVRYGMQDVGRRRRRGLNPSALNFRLGGGR